jgi:hypothetical protein
LRRAPGLRTVTPCVQPLELCVQLPQSLIGHLTDGAQWMILRHPLFKADAAEYRLLLMVVSAHINYLNHPHVETIVPLPVPQPFFRKLLSRAGGR